MKYLSIHTNDLCDNSCFFCVVSSPLMDTNSVSEISVNKFLRENSDQGFMVVNLHGGEPLVSPIIDKILIEIKKNQYPSIHMQTNGILLSDNRLAKKYVDLGVDKFIISYHADSDTTSKFLTERENVHKMVNKAIVNLKNLGAKIRTNTVINTFNVSKLSEISNQLIDLDVDEVNISNLHPEGSASFCSDKFMVKINNFKKEIYKAIDILEERGVVDIRLEGFPYCFLSEKMYLQLNNKFRYIKMLFRNIVIGNYDHFMKNQQSVYKPRCANCLVRDKCGGIYPLYLEIHGDGEVRPINSAL